MKRLQVSTTKLLSIWVFLGVTHSALCIKPKKKQHCCPHSNANNSVLVCLSNVRGNSALMESLARTLESISWVSKGFLRILSHPIRLSGRGLTC